ncbi:MAG: 3-dehydroquinate synthase [Clostridia bacterium]|nr:3-dehydroquinate synthase [Clostridia bacterium]
MISIKVKASKTYEVSVTQDFNDLRQVVDGVKSGDKIAVITDTNVEKLYLSSVIDALEGFDVSVHTIPAGESSKNLSTYCTLIQDIALSSLDRSDMIITLGGGVVGDIGAFVASTYLRGIRLVAIPTTLLSMIDSSVGGKTAVDLPIGKNLVGTFYQPNAVYINVSCIDTLPTRELMSGYGELIKYAILDDRISIDDMKVLDSSLIAKAVSIKRDIVEADEYEGGLRKLLNLGHTIGHAVESLSNYTLSHGECVVKGLRAILDVSSRYYDMKDSDYTELDSIIRMLGHDCTMPYSVDEVIDYVYRDKKKKGDLIDIVLIKAKGEVEIVSMPIDKVRRYLSEYQD